RTRESLRDDTRASGEGLEAGASPRRRRASLLRLLLLSVMAACIAPAPAWSQVLRHISVASDGTQANGDSFSPGFSGDGRVATFVSYATNLGGCGGGTGQIFVRDTLTQTTSCVSVSSSGTPANAASFNPSATPRLSADGTAVVFGSQATN